MIVSVTGSAAEVLERDDLKRLHVEAASADDVDAGLQACGLGHLKDGHAWLAVSALREQGAGTAPDWPAQYDAMIAYAAGKGWCSSDGTYVQAHVERKADV